MTTPTPNQTDRECAKKIAYYFPPPTETTATAMIYFQRIETISKEIATYRIQLQSEVEETLQTCRRAIQSPLQNKNHHQLVDDALAKLQERGILENLPYDQQNEKS